MLALTQTKVGFESFLDKGPCQGSCSTLHRSQGREKLPGAGGNQEMLYRRGGTWVESLWNERQEHGCVLDKVSLLTPTPPQLHS